MLLGPCAPAVLPHLSSLTFLHLAPHWVAFNPAMELEQALKCRDLQVCPSKRGNARAAHIAVHAQRWWPHAATPSSGQPHLSGPRRSWWWEATPNPGCPRCRGVRWRS